MDRTRSLKDKSRYRKGGVSAAVSAQRRALRMARRSTTLMGIPRMSQATYVARTELKGMDTTIAFSPVLDTTNTNGNTLTCNLIQAGTGSWNRIGRKTQLVSMRIQGTATCRHWLDVNTDVLGNVIRLVVVWDRQPSGGAEPVFNDIFGVTSQGGVETATFFSPPKYDTMDRYRVIKDWYIESEAEATPTAGNYVQNEFQIDCYIPLPNLETNFSGQSSPMTIADINSGSLYLIARSLRNVADRSDWAVAGNVRIRYRDA